MIWQGLNTKNEGRNGISALNGGRSGISDLNDEINGISESIHSHSSQNYLSILIAVTICCGVLTIYGQLAVKCRSLVFGWFRAVLLLATVLTAYTVWGLVAVRLVDNHQQPAAAIGAAFIVAVSCNLAYRVSLIFFACHLTVFFEFICMAKYICVIVLSRNTKIP